MGNYPVCLNHYCQEIKNKVDIGLRGKPVSTYFFQKKTINIQILKDINEKYGKIERDWYITRLKGGT